MPNKTNRYARKPTPAAKPGPVKKPVAKVDEDSEARHEVFKANLPLFRATVRGNVVADSESFQAQSGETYDTFRIAYTRIRNNEKHTMFIKVIAKHVPDFAVLKGNYVEVSGDYSDDGVTPASGKYEATVFRTLFMGDDDTCKVLIG